MSSNNCRGTYLSENNNEFILHNRRFSKSSSEKSDRTESTRISTRAIDKDKTSNQSSLSYARRLSLSSPGRSSGTVYSSRRSRISTNIGSNRDLEMDKGDNGICLVQTRRHKIPLKDFNDEVRSVLDVDHFLCNATVVLDIKNTRVTEIVSQMLKSDELTASIDFDCIAPYIFTSEIITQAHGDSDTFKDCMQAAFEDVSGLQYQKSWVACQATVPFIQHPKILIGRLSEPRDLSHAIVEGTALRIVILILTPPKSKLTKTCTEISRSISTFFSSHEFTSKLYQVATPEDVLKLINERKKELSTINEKEELLEIEELPGVENIPVYHIGRGLLGDVRRRAPWYLSDFIDVFKDLKSVSKLVSTTVFLFFACLLPSIAFGSLNDGTTGGIITVQKTIMAQAFGGLVFALFSGQPLVILLTTAPLALYISIIQELATTYEYDFLAFYAAIGIINAMFLIIYVMINLSKLMKFSTRSIEEIFGFFITCAFCKDALKHLSASFDHYYGENQHVVLKTSENEIVNMSCNIHEEYDAIPEDCLMNSTLYTDVEFHTERDKALLALIMTLGTAWFGLLIFNFRKSPFLPSSIRELISDYALALSVIVFSLIGSVGFSAIKLESFNYSDVLSLEVTYGIRNLPASGWGWALLLGFCLSLLFFMDQNISAALVNTPTNKLKKGAAYHLDLLVVALINIPLSLLGLPWIHGALPHSPLHARALADVSESVEDGHVKESILFIRETRMSGVLAHILIGFSLFAVPTPLTSIPKPVLDGLFLFLGLSGLYGNQFWERMLLVFTEQNAYPPNHYVRRVPQKQIHIFTACQFVQLLVLAFIGFYPYAYLKMIFPVIILLLMPMRHMVIPKIVPEKYLRAMDNAL